MDKTVLASDILEQQFGPTMLDILYQEGKTRIICTKVKASGQVLELSRVEFMQPGIDAFPDIHQAIIAGQSMGKAFRTHKVAFIRNVDYAYKHTLPDNFSQRFSNSDPANVVGIVIKIGPQQLPYATILETYSPAVSWPHLTHAPTAQQLDEIHRFNSALQTL